MNRDDLFASKRLVDDLRDLKAMSPEDLERYIGKNQHPRRP